MSLCRLPVLVDNKHRVYWPAGGRTWTPNLINYGTFVWPSAELTVRFRFFLGEIWILTHQARPSAVIFWIRKKDAMNRRYIYLLTILNEFSYFHRVGIILNCDCQYSLYTSLLYVISHHKLTKIKKFLCGKPNPHPLMSSSPLHNRNVCVVQRIVLKTEVQIPIIIFYCCTFCEKSLAESLASRSVQVFYFHFIILSCCC